MRRDAVSPAPPDAPLSFYVEYGPDPSEPELRLFIASSASPPKLPKASQPPKSSKPRKPTLARVAREASKAGIEVARYEVKPDGTVVAVVGKPEPTEATNPWLADLDKVKQQ